jgi:hypothetical protein
MSYPSQEAVESSNRHGDSSPSVSFAAGPSPPPLTSAQTLRSNPLGGVVGVKLEGSGFDSISRIPVVREGETIYALKPFGCCSR